MFGWFSKYHGLSAVLGVATAMFGIAQQATVAGIIKGPAAVVVVAVGSIVAAFSQAPGTPKAP